MLLSVRAVEKSFETTDGPQPVLRDVSFDLTAGRTLALTGESGSGKSTLLHLVAGLDIPDSGTILVEGQDIAAMGDGARAAMRRDTVGLVFQQFNLIPSLNVADNLTFHARLAGRDPGNIFALAERLGLGDHLHRFPEQLSGGQQQRVAIGRTLAARPRLVLADEPTGNLDPGTSDTVFAALLTLVRETGMAALIATHNLELAGRMDRVLRLDGGRLA